jgi:hypothetical protein
VIRKIPSDFQLVVNEADANAIAYGPGLVSGIDDPYPVEVE